MPPSFLATAPWRHRWALICSTPTCMPQIRIMLPGHMSRKLPGVGRTELEVPTPNPAGSTPNLVESHSRIGRTPPTLGRNHPNLGRSLPVRPNALRHWSQSPQGLFACVPERPDRNTNSEANVVRCAVVHTDGNLALHHISVHDFRQSATLRKLLRNYSWTQRRRPRGSMRTVLKECYPPRRPPQRCREEDRHFPPEPSRSSSHTSAADLGRIGPNNNQDRPPTSTEVCQICLGR